MRKLRALWLRFRNLWSVNSPTAEIDDELATHVAMHIADGIREGLSEEEGRRRALVRLGGAEQTRQAYRERFSLVWLEDLVHDMRFAVRMMGRNRGFTCVAILTLAVGIAACTTGFTWINAVLLTPLGGVSDPDRLVA